MAASMTRRTSLLSRLSAGSLKVTTAKAVRPSALTWAAPSGP
jgi:hypothetical protein